MKTDADRIITMETKQVDMAKQIEDIKSDIKEFKTEVKNDISEVKDDIKNLQISLARYATGITVGWIAIQFVLENFINK
jgi:gas vesicle protein